MSEKSYNNGEKYIFETVLPEKMHEGAPQLTVELDNTCVTDVSARQVQGRLTKCGLLA